MFKKKNTQKKTDFTKDIETINTDNNDNNLNHLSKSKKINKDDKYYDKQQKIDEPKRLIKYGLIQKQIKSTEQKPKLENFFINLYIKKRLEQIHTKQKKQAGDTTAIQILQMQKQYLSAAQSKITQYDVKQIQKKLQKMSTEYIKTQIQNRNKYLIDLLQNQHERMQYASKKEIKVMKQQRERLERDLSSKYKEDGRRHYIQYIKTNNLNGMY